MFDLIDESGKDLKRHGYKINEVGNLGTSVASLLIDSSEKSQKLGLDEGEYYIITSPQIYENERAEEELAILVFDKLKKMIKDFEGKRTLIVGLGNPDIWADALGKAVTDEVFIDPLDNNNHIFKFCPNIFFSTGINTFDMVAILVKGLDIECVIVVDSLATNSLERLGKSVQLSSAGMTPGSAVNKLGKRIEKNSVGCPCFSIGVPFMIFASKFANEEGDAADGQAHTSGTAQASQAQDMLLAPKDIHENLLTMARVIGKSLNMLL